MPRKDAQPGAKEIAAARRLKVLDYRKAGLSFRAITERLEKAGEVTSTGNPVSFQQVHRDYKKAMKDIVIATQSTKEEMVVLESERLDMARVALAASVAKSDKGAIKLWVEVSESYRKLHGLDKPIQIEDVTKPAPKLDFSKLSLSEKRLLEELLLRAQADGPAEDEDEDDEE